MKIVIEDLYKFATEFTTQLERCSKLFHMGCTRVQAYEIMLVIDDPVNMPSIHKLFSTLEFQTDLENETELLHYDGRERIQ